MIVLIATIDSSNLGRINKASLPQQTLMEILTQELSGNGFFQEVGGGYRDIRTWTGVAVSDGDVVSIDWRHEENVAARPWSNILSKFGSIDLQWIPSTVRVFDIGNLALRGSVVTSSLPRGMESFNLAGNNFFGDFFLGGLPDMLKRCHVNNNELTGSLQLENLPRGLLQVSLSANRFWGTINLTKLPDGMTRCLLGDNALSGTVDLTHLPNGLKTLTLGKNDFEGETDFSELPRSLQFLIVANTRLSGKIVKNGHSVHVVAGECNVQVV